MAQGGLATLISFCGPWDNMAGTLEYHIIGGTGINGVGVSWELF